MQNRLWMKGIVLGILVLFIGSSSAGGYSGYLERLKGIQDTLIDDSKLFNSSIMAGFDDIQKDFEYRKQVIAEEEHYKQLMEEEYLRNRNNHRLSHEFLSHDTFEDLSYIRPLRDVHYYLLDNVSDGVLEKHVSKPRPLPTGRKLYVGGSGSNNYTKIQDALNVAVGGYTVFVYDDSSPYYENIVVHYSNTTLIGENRDTTIIEGANSFEDVITIGDDWVNINGFTIQNGSYGINVWGSSFNTIFGNNISKNKVGGIYIRDSSNNNVYSNYLLNNHKDGIFMFDSSYNRITNNSFKSNGLLFHTSFLSNDLNYFNTHTIENNKLNDGFIRYFKNTTNVIVPSDTTQLILVNCSNFTIKNLNLSGGSCGVQILYSSYNKFNNNNISNNNRTGIDIFTSSENKILNNIILDNNEGGISLSESSNNNIISYNNILNNDWDNIYIVSSTNNLISRNCVSNTNDDGIYIGGHSSNNYIIDNNISNNYHDGIWISESWNNNIDGNILSKNKGHGISLTSSLNNTIINNIFSYNGINIGGRINNLNTHTIENNKLNDGFIRYFKNTTNVIVPSDTTQLILVNCSNFTIKNLNLSDGSYGVDLWYSNYNTLYNNTISKNRVDGIYMKGSSNNNISGNNISNNSANGIFMAGSSNNNNTISVNNISNNKGDGIYLECSSNNNTVFHNTVTNNSGNGIVFSFSSNNTIKKNTILQNYECGIALYICYYYKISDNICISNKIDGIGEMYCFFTTIENNTCLNNMKGIAIRDPSFEHDYLFPTGLNSIKNNTCKRNLLQGILLNSAGNNTLQDNNCSYNSIGIYLYDSANNSIIRNHCNHNDFDGIVLENNSNFNILSNNVAGPYNWVGIVIQTSTFNQLSHNDVYQNVGYGIVLLKTIRNKLHYNNIYDNAEYDLLGLACFDDARWNYWGGGFPNKMVLGWAPVFPWLSAPAKSSGNLDNLVAVDMSTLTGFRSLSSSLLKRELSYPVKGWIS